MINQECWLKKENKQKPQKKLHVGATKTNKKPHVGAVTDLILSANSEGSLILFITSRNKRLQKIVKELRQVRNVRVTHIRVLKMSL